MTVSIVAASRRTFRSLREYRNYRLWFMGQLFSLSGTWVQNTAQAWFVADHTHSALAVGVLALCQYGPYTIFGLAGGHFADRFAVRRLLIATQSGLMVTPLVLGLLALTGQATVWEIDLLAAVSGLLLIADTPARQAFTIQMVGRRELANAVALNSSMFNLSRVVGPTIAGILLATTSAGVCFLVNAASFLAVLISLALMDPKQLHSITREMHRQGFLRATLAGMSYTVKTPAIRLVIGLLFVVATFGMNFTVVLPILAQQTYHAGPAIFGFLTAAFGGGALLGALAIAFVGRPRWSVLFGAGIIYGVALIVLAPVEQAGWALPILFIAGLAFALYASTTNSTVQMIVPDQLRGRVMGLYSYVFFGTAPLGGILMGSLMAHGSFLALVISGGTILLAVLGAAGVHRFSIARA